MWKKIKGGLAAILVVLGFIAVLAAVALVCFSVITLSIGAAIALGGLAAIAVAFVVDKKKASETLGKVTEGIKETIGSAIDIAGGAVNRISSNILSNPFVLLFIGVAVYFLFIKEDKFVYSSGMDGRGWSVGFAENQAQQDQSALQGQVVIGLPEQDKLSRSLQEEEWLDGERS